MQRTILLWYGFFWLSAARRKSRCSQLHRQTFHPFDYVLVVADNEREVHRSLPRRPRTAHRRHRTDNRIQSITTKLKHTLQCHFYGTSKTVHAQTVCSNSLILIAFDKILASDFGI